MAIMQVTMSVEFMQVFKWYFVTVMLVDLSVAIMQVTVSVAIIQVIFSAVHYTHDCFYCNYADDSFFMQGDSFKL